MSDWEPKKRIVTGCCDDSKKYKTPHLSFDMSGRRGSSSEALLSTLKPRWSVRARSTYDRDSSIEFDENVEVRFCPFCGEKTPEIRPNTTIKKKIYDTDSGDYCETCGERSMCCKCLPAEFRWEVSK